MNDNQKEFLNELGNLFDKYNIDVVRAGNENNDGMADIEFWSNNQKLAFHEYIGYKRERQSIQERGEAPIGVFSNVSTFFYETEYCPKEEEPNNE